MMDALNRFDEYFRGSRTRYALVAVLACIPFLAMVGNPLVGDALLAVSNNEAVQSQSLANLLKVDFWGFPLDADYGTGSYRPLVSLTYALQARLLGNSPQLFHLADLVFHALAAALVVVLMETLGVRTRWAMAAGLLFAVHPVQSEAVVSVVGRADIMAAISLLSALIFHLRAAGRQNRWIFEGAALLALVAGLFCKEYAVAFPFILIAVDIAAPTGRDDLREGYGRWPVWAASLLLLAFYLLLRHALIGRLGGVPMLTAADHPLHDAGMTTRWSMAARLLLLAGRLLIAPFALNHHYRYGTLEIVNRPWEPAALAGIVLLAASFAAAIWWMRRRKAAMPVAAAVLFFFPLLPALNTVSLSGVLFAERFLYIPVAGPVMLLCWIADRSADRKRFATAALALLVVALLLFGTLSAVRVADWRSAERLARSSLRWYPNGSEVWMQLGLALGEEGRDDEAIEAFERSLEIQPKHSRAWQSYAAALSRVNRYEESAAAWRMAIDLAPPDIGPLWRGLGEAEMKAGNEAEALDALRTAHELSVWDAPGAAALARALLDANEPREAVQVLRETLESTDHGRETLTLMLGHALLRDGQRRLGEGKRQEGIELAREAVGLGVLPPEGIYLAGLLAFRAREGEQARLWFDLALKQDPDLLRKKHEVALRLEEEGRYYESAVVFREILAADPDHAPTLFNLGRALLLAGRPKQAISPLRRGLEITDDPRARDMLAQAIREARN